MKIQKRQEIEFFGTKTGNANSIALGYATETKNFGEVAVGVMNKSTAAKDPNSPKGVCVDSDATLFSVGCGGSGERKNALEVKGDGSVLISGEDGDINVADKIKQALDTDASIELVKSADSDLQYTLMVNNESRGSINIPKDQFLKNVTYDTEAKQLVFTFVTLDEEEHVERISINDLKDVYTAGDGINIDNNVISADFSSVMTAISDEKTQRETTDNEIKSTLDTKADKTDTDSRLDDLSNYCFKFGDYKQVAAPYKTYFVSTTILRLNNDKKYTYAKIGGAFPSDKSNFIYDKNLDKSINVTNAGDSTTDYGTFFITAESIDLTHNFYVEGNGGHWWLSINKSHLFADIPYRDSSDNLTEDTKRIYDATDKKWIDVVFAIGVERYAPFNTEGSLDLTHELYYTRHDSILGHWSTVGYNSTAFGYNANSSGYSSTALGCETVATGDWSTALGYNASAAFRHSLALGAQSSVGSSYAIALGNNVPNTKSIFGVGFNGENGIDMDGDNYGLYLKGFGGYDGTNLVVKSGDTETLNPNIKSVQQIINEKADASAVPTKLSDLENDKVNITTSKDETSYSFKIDYKDGDVLRSALRYKPYVNNTNIAEFGLYSFDTAGNRFSQIRMRPEENKDDGQYVIHVQNVNGDTVNKVSSISTTGFDNQNYENGTAVLVESDKLEFYVNSNGFQKQLTMNKDGITKKDGKATEVFAADGTLFDLTTKADTSAIPTKTSQLTNDSGYLTEHQSLADYAKKTEIPDISNKADLVDGKLKADQLPKLDNIAAATTTEDMITKFNALLTDLKAKGYMTADITA